MAALTMVTFCVDMCVSAPGAHAVETCLCTTIPPLSPPLHPHTQPCQCSPCSFQALIPQFGLGLRVYVNRLPVNLTYDEGTGSVPLDVGGCVWVAVGVCVRVCV